MRRSEMLEKYKELGYTSGTTNVKIEIPLAFVDDFTTEGILGDENKIVECFNRVLSEVRYSNVPTIGRYDREILEMFAVAFSRAEIGLGVEE